MGRDYNRDEIRQAKKDGATPVKNSGRGMNKGDSILGDYMIDYKITSKSSYSLNLKKFHDLEKQAWRERKTAITVAVFEEHGGKTVAIIEWEALKELINEQQG